ncbi:MAG: hypothetical protein FWD83_00190 [Promicromonosporaceae bacterium]|nr:hypothetical protein [Promicromonosporaceae bacterium]
MLDRLHCEATDATYSPDGSRNGRQIGELGMRLALDLARLHSEGNVLGPLTPTGMPPTGWNTADDVHSLAQLLGRMLAGRPRQEQTALIDAITAAADPDPRCRPQAGTFAAMLDEALAREVRPRVRKPRRMRMAAGGIGIAIALAAGMLVESATSNSAPTLAEASSDPAIAAAALIQQRLRLLGEKEPELSSVNAPDSPALAADTALAAELVATGTRPIDAQAQLDFVETITADEASAQVSIEYRILEHRTVGAEGTEQVVSESGVLTATLILVWTDDGWRIEAVE